MPFGLTGTEVAVGVGLFVGTTALSTTIVVAYVIAMRADYFTGPRSVRAQGRRRIALTVGRNVLGALLVAVGVVLAIPGVPGQGLLTILVGLLLTDVPGKRRLVRRLLALPGSLAAVNRLRARFRRPPIGLE
jgi:hypothetical protein